MTGYFQEIYKGKKVVVTGHTGFKGSWLCYWLTQLGAQVTGISWGEVSNPSHFPMLKLSMESIEQDIRDAEGIRKVLLRVQPDIVFHLAAQALVRRSYRAPLETLQTNIMGTAHMLEALRGLKHTRAFVNVTSDKCYENREQDIAYKETDPMGGYDPYSMSKGCAELVAQSYRNAFFNLDKYGDTHQLLIASARAGNVIGGGDWAEDRLIPDIVRAAAEGKSVVIRNPQATRPWQHVLEPLSGYLLLGSRLLVGDKSCAEGWNFGPTASEVHTVDEVLKQSLLHWEAIKVAYETQGPKLHEAKLLCLDCEKANTLLSWFPVWNHEETVQYTIEWYKGYYSQGSTNTATDLERYIQAARSKKIIWTHHAV